MAQSIVDSLEKQKLVKVGADGSLSPSQLGNAVVWSGLSPSAGLAVFRELERARLQFNLESELHVLYLLAPNQLLEQVKQLDYYRYMMVWENLPDAWKRVGNLVGVDEMCLARAINGKFGSEGNPETARHVANLRRFYW